LFLGKPIPDDLPKEVPWEPDFKRKTEKPFSLMSWVDRHADQLKHNGSIPLFDQTSYQSDVIVHGFGDSGKSFGGFKNAETFLWILKGQATLDLDGQKFDLKFDDTFLVPAGNSKFTFASLSENAAILSTTMDAGNKSRVGV
jgi:mannose-6-phosphate isomerase-like protein (cupin superfamily)